MEHKGEAATSRDLTVVADSNDGNAEYQTRKRKKIEEALRYADHHPDDFVTMSDMCRKYGLSH